VTLPNFLVIGAGRSGTTSLHHYLKAHPDIYVPAVKSPSHFYCCGRTPAHDADHPDYFVPDPADYEALFDGVRGETAIGEVSPAYLASVHAAPRIAERVPGARLIALLRHPVDRAFARFVGRCRDGLEPRTDFGEVVRDELKAPLIRDEAAGTYLAAGFVSHFLVSYFERFARDRMRIHLFEDFQRDPAAVMRNLYAFLDVDPAFAPDVSRRHNQSGGVIHNRLLRRVWVRSATLRTRLRPHLPEAMRDRLFRVVARTLDPVRLDPQLRADLIALYRDDIVRLSGLLDRDLSHWLAPEPRHSAVPLTAHPAR
jgi:hypothetical protein